MLMCYIIEVLAVSYYHCVIFRFLHHVLSYRGPTLTFLRGQEGVEFCLAADSEWHESNHYWGCENSCILQILPLFHVIERM